VFPVSRRAFHLARLALGPACAALVAATAALAQGDDHRHHDGGRGPEPRDAPWVGREPPRAHGGREGDWDQGRYNGYWVGPRWYYGAPQGPAYQTPGFRPGFVPWRRGAYLPPQ
jgi:Ni/Co efflux regulator RcnB